MPKGPNDFSQAAKQQSAAAKSGKLPPAAGKVCFDTLVFLLHFMYCPHSTQLTGTLLGLVGI